MDALLTNASQIYAIGYLGVLIVVAVLEGLVPRRAPGNRLVVRWTSNFGITVLNTFVARALFPLAGIAWAIFCRDHGWGLFNATSWPAPLAVLLTIGALDFLFYAQHYLLHRVPLLWRFHRVHHTDHEFDFSTGVRFHPLEATFTTTLHLGVILALGAPPVAVLFSQVLSAAADFIEHANVRLPGALDRVVRLVVVTPDMHRIHHSQAPGESRSNLSNTFSWWDRVFGTYVDQPAAGHDGLAFGLPEFLDAKHATLPWMLAQPFLSEGDAPGTSPEPSSQPT